MKSRTIFMILISLFLLTSCASRQQTADSRVLEFFNQQIMENTTWKLENVAELESYRADAICSDGENLYVLCKEQNQILELSENGEQLGVIGGVGSQPGQLFQPAAMAWDGQYLMVAEQGNLRLQAFQPDGTSVFTLPLPVNGEQTAFVRSIAPWEDGYLVCLIFPYEKDANTVWHIDQHGQAEPLMKNIRGVFAWTADRLYLIEDLVYVGDGNISYQAGEASVWQFDEGRFIHQAALPYGYVMTSTVKTADSWYAVNCSFYSLDRFDDSWNYISTGFMMANQEKNVMYEGQNLSIALCKRKLFLLSTSSGTIYRIWMGDGDEI